MLKFGTEETMDFGNTDIPSAFERWPPPYRRSFGVLGVHARDLQQLDWSVLLITLPRVYLVRLIVQREWSNSDKERKTGSSQFYIPPSHLLSPPSSLPFFPLF